MARPKVEINEEQLGALCRLVATLKDCAHFFKCSHDIIERRVREWGYDSFASFKEENMVHTRFKLKRIALQRAETSDAALIFCLKNICGWTDKLVHAEDPNIKQMPDLDQLTNEEKQTILKLIKSDAV